MYLQDQYTRFKSICSDKLDIRLIEIPGKFRDGDGEYAKLIRPETETWNADHTQKKTQVWDYMVFAAKNSCKPDNENVIDSTVSCHEAIFNNRNGNDYPNDYPYKTIVFVVKGRIFIMALEDILATETYKNWREGKTAAMVNFVIRNCNAVEYDEHGKKKAVPIIPKNEVLVFK
jgi:hypothetical protein